MKRSAAVFICILIVLSAFTGCAKKEISPLMWRVTDASGHVLYLFGTIHVGDGRTDKALEAVTPVMLSCDALAVEFDVLQFEKDLEAGLYNDLVLSMAYTDGTMAVDHMPEELHGKAVELLKEAGQYDLNTEFFNLSMWSSLIDQALISLTSGLSSDDGMDVKLITAAKENALRVLDVESAAFQYKILSDFPDDLYVILIGSAIESRDEYGDAIRALYSCWLSGDESGMISLLSEEQDAEDEDMTDEEIAMIDRYNKAMLDDRNIGMADKAEEYIASGDTVFFAVGEAHMLGENGLASLLRERGYDVELYDYKNKG